MQSRHHVRDLNFQAEPARAQHPVVQPRKGIQGRIGERGIPQPHIVAQGEITLGLSHKLTQYNVGDIVW